MSNKKRKPKKNHPWKIFVPKEEQQKAKERGQKVIPHHARMGVRG